MNKQHIHKRYGQWWVSLPLAPHSPGWGFPDIRRAITFGKLLADDPALGDIVARPVQNP